MAGFVRDKVSSADSFHWALFNTLVTTHDALANTIGTGFVTMFSVHRFTGAHNGGEVCTLHNLSCFFSKPNYCIVVIHSKRLQLQSKKNHKLT
jgi:hypothetical protein